MNRKIDHASYKNDPFQFRSFGHSNALLISLLFSHSGHRKMWLDHHPIDSGAAWYGPGRCASAKEAAEHGRHRGLLHRIGRLHLYTGQLREGHLPGHTEDLRDSDPRSVAMRDPGEASLLAALRIPTEPGHRQNVLGRVSR